MRTTKSLLRRFFHLAALLFVSIPVQATAQAGDPLDGLDAYITNAMKDWQIPGVAVGIVKGDSVVFAKGFGTRTVGRNEPVDTHTLFALASDSKQFTGILLAMLADDGKVKWDAHSLHTCPRSDLATTISPAP
jgi:CubicO group peptidase (beta-lactamase class C family)